MNRTQQNAEPDREKYAVLRKCRCRLDSLEAGRLPQALCIYKKDNGILGMDELNQILIGISGTVIGGILGYLIRVFIEHRLAIDRIKENIKITEFNKAAASIRAAFAPSLSILYLAKKHGSTHEAPNLDKHLKDAMLEQSSAIEIFRPYVEKHDRDSFQKAWEDYRYEVWNYGFDANAMNDEIDEYEVYEKKIQTILKYAEIK